MWGFGVQRIREIQNHLIGGIYQYCYRIEITVQAKVEEPAKKGVRGGVHPHAHLFSGYFNSGLRRIEYRKEETNE